MRPGSALTLFLLVASTALAQAPPARWAVPGGDAGHTGALPGTLPTLDVVRAFRVADESAPGGLGTYYKMLAVETPHGLYLSENRTAAAGGGECTWIRVDDVRAGLFERLSPAPCAGPRRILAYDATRDRLLVDDGAGTLAALDARDLAVVWQAAGPVPGALGGGQWSAVADAVLDDDRLVVVWTLVGDPQFGTSSGNRISVLDAASGAVVWERSVTAPTSLVSGAFVQEVGDPAGFTPYGVAAAASGYLVTGRTMQDSAVAWLSRDGVLRGGASAAESSAVALDPRGTAVSSPQRPVASGNIAAALFRASILVADPEAVQSTRFERGRTFDSSNAEPVWAEDRFLAPFNTGVAAHESSGFRHLWEWGGLSGNVLADQVADARSAYALHRALTLDGTEQTLVRLDIANGAPTQRIPLPTTDSARDVAHLLPLSDGETMLVVTASGWIFVLAPSASRGTMDLATDRPAVDEIVTLTLPDLAGARYAIAWGDGETTEARPGARPEHRYQSARRVTLAVTAASPDGTTSTTERAIFVGEPHLTPVQRAFSPENQEITFFVLGLALTGGGALFAALLRRRRHSRLAQEERLLRAVVDESLLKPSEGLAMLEAHRGHLRDQHTRRRLDDAQFGLLDHRTVRAMKAARYRLLGSALNKLTPHFRRLLDTALEDGQVTSGEMAALVDAIDEESALTPLEKERVRALLSNWAR